MWIVSDCRGRRATFYTIADAHLFIKRESAKIETIKMNKFKNLQLSGALKFYILVDQDNKQYLRNIPIRVIGEEIITFTIRDIVSQDFPGKTPVYTCNTCVSFIEAKRLAEGSASDSEIRKASVNLGTFDSIDYWTLLGGFKVVKS